MKTTIVTLGFFLFAIGFSVAQYPNILVGNQHFPNEPAIIFSPSDPARMVTGSNMDSYFYSTDAGLSWSQGTLTSAYGIWGDPCIVADTNGVFYYFHINLNPQTTVSDQIICHRSSDGGITWDVEIPFGKAGDKNQEKVWAVADPETNDLYATWTQNDAFGSTNPLDSSIIRFSRSTDQGLTWSEPVRLNRTAGHCILDGFAVNGSIPAMGANGEIMVAWVGPDGVMFTKSTDKGITWPATNVTVADLPVGWGCLVPGIYRAPAFPVIACDRSNGPYHGTCYIGFFDQRNGQNDTDVWLCRSTDGGLTWSDPLRVNDDPPGSQQFFSWMTVDQATGYLYFVFYDRRNYSDSHTDVYMALSKDGGQTFTNFLVSESPFLPNGAIFIGDYTNLIAHNHIVRPVWTRMENDQLSIWTAKVDSVGMGVPPGPDPYSQVVLSQNYPNPSSGYTCFAYKVRESSCISLVICDYTGREVATVFENRFHTPGQYIERYPIDKAILPPGFYFYSLRMKNQYVMKKMIID